MRILHRTQNQNSISMLTTRNGATTSSTSEAITTLMEEHFRGCVPTEDRGIPDHKPTIPTPFPWISVELISKAIKSFGADKAAGPDELKPIILHHFPTEFLQRLEIIFRACITNGYTPAAWRHSKVIFIPKQGKPNYSDPRAFRPITLLSFLFKTLEKLVYWHIESTALTYKPFHPNQHAFRKGFSTDTALTTLTNRIERAITTGHSTLAAFLDIEGAFDNITTEAIVAGMEFHHIPTYLIKWYHEYLLNRSSTTTYGDATITRQITRGTPQGSILSPPIYNMNSDRLLFSLEKEATNTIAFADDTEADISGPDIPTLANLLQTTLTKINSWCEDSGLRINYNKSKIMLFTRKYKKSVSYPPIFIGPHRIDYATSIKYLGLTLTPTLNWTPHIIEKTKKAKSLLSMLRAAIGRTWGPKPSLMAWAFSGIIRPMVTYGCHIWLQSCQSKQISTQLIRIQRLALTRLANTREKTPTAGLEIILNVPPLSLYAQEKATKTWLRIKDSIRPGWDGLGRSNNKGHVRYIQDILTHLPINNIPREAIPPAIRRYQFYTCAITPSPTLSPDISIYTDGSKINDMAGSGHVIYHSAYPYIYNKTSTHLGPMITVFQAELHAIKEACSFIISDSNIMASRKQVVIFCDNQAVIHAIQLPYIKSSLLLETIDKLNYIGSRHQLHVQWCKGHVGIQGNEQADTMAKLGAQARSNGPTPLLPLSNSTINTWLHNLTTTKWTQIWKQNTTCRQTKIWFPSPNKLISKTILHLERQTLGPILRWITGHNFLRRHSSLLNETQNPMCRLCHSEEETAWHILGECEPLCSIRNQIFATPFLDYPPDWNPKQILQFLNHPTISNLETQTN